VWFTSIVGRLVQVNGTRASCLEPEHLVGRAEHSSLHIPHSYVSAQHALLRWTENVWELTDRGSRNGTWLDGVQLRSGQTDVLRQGAVLSFGQLGEQWVLEDATEPCVFIEECESESFLLGVDGVIGIPSNDLPECTAYRDRDGTWKLESADHAALMLRNGDRFEWRGREYRFSSPRLVRATETAEYLQSPGPLVLEFIVSQDEEFVKLRAEAPNRTIDLGSRSHNYLLLTLARSRLADGARKLTEGACGWVDKDWLAAGLQMTPSQLDLEVFRIRKHFAHHGLEEAASVIERRPRTKQLRLGLGAVRITRS